MKTLLCFTVILIISLSVFPQQSKVVETVGTCYGVDKTPDQARKKALESARTEAIKQVVGVKISEEAFRNVTEVLTGNSASEFRDVFSSFNKSSSYGKIIKEEVNYEQKFEGEIPVYVVKLTATVVEEEGKPDPSFEAKIVLERRDLYDRGGDRSKNDELKFRLWASQNAYLYLFTISANDSVQLLLPNNDVLDNYYAIDRSEQEFSKKMQQLIMRFIVGLPNDKEEQEEGLLLVALKNKIDFHSGKISSDGKGGSQSYKAALTDIMQWLIQIPLSERTETFEMYTIKKFKQ
ncbi:MAG: hypothetical protein COW85_10545 [Ignavibacteria bacterium CG22_combo_CG10-13_8_21_14_all_37_15]|nr:MAG: hypothetical protein COW85_10545 [Ignavibacteria bacterium CG22_combo_CG10-13_8_21_14_all_37_15]